MSAGRGPADRPDGPSPVPEGPMPLPGEQPPTAGRQAAEITPDDGIEPAEARAPVAVGPGSVPPEPRRDQFAVETRLAHVHVRVGMYPLARAELETLAAKGALDVPALADLAEVRWRTGDLAGAGEAAEAYIGAGGDELVPLCVAAEAAAAAGRMAQARHLASRVLARGRDRLDDLFAGQARSAIWPGDQGGEEKGSVPGGRGRSSALPSTAAADLADIQSRVARGEIIGAAARLALVLRAQPVLAPAVLAVADDAVRVAGVGPEAAALHVVRGDAYRLMGRETLATEAFHQSSRALRSAAPPDDGTGRA